MNVRLVRLTRSWIYCVLTEKTERGRPKRDVVYEVAECDVKTPGVCGEGAEDRKKRKVGTGVTDPEY